jgi:hypothetical protein
MRLFSSLTGITPCEMLSENAEYIVFTWGRAL